MNGPSWRRAASGLASVPHAGEIAGPASIRGALGRSPGRSGSGIDPRGRGSGAPARARRPADLCSTSARSRTCEHGWSEIAEHPLPALVAAGALCSISTDDPAFFDTDLSKDYAAACQPGLEPHGLGGRGRKRKKLMMSRCGAAAGDRRSLRLVPSPPPGSRYPRELDGQRSCSGAAKSRQALRPVGGRNGCPASPERSSRRCLPLLRRQAKGVRPFPPSSSRGVFVFGVGSGSGIGDLAARQLEPFGSGGGTTTSSGVKKALKTNADAPERSECLERPGHRLPDRREADRGEHGVRARPDASPERRRRPPTGCRLLRNGRELTKDAEGRNDPGPGAALRRNRSPGFYVQPDRPAPRQLTRCASSCRRRRTPRWRNPDSASQKAGRPSNQTPKLHPTAGNPRYLYAQLAEIAGDFGGGGGGLQEGFHVYARAKRGAPRRASGAPRYWLATLARAPPDRGLDRGSG